MGRARICHSLVSEHDAGDQILPASGRRGALRIVSRAAARKSRCMALRGRRMRSCTWAWSRPESGLIPAGGGCKEMLLRAVDAAARAQRAGASDSVELIDTLRRRTFETIAMAKVSTSAAKRADMGFLTAADGITMNRERLLQDAKARAREMADAGYSAPVPRTDDSRARRKCAGLRSGWACV